MKNKLYAIGVTILMMTSCTQDELISSDNGKEPATAGSCLTLVGLSSPQTRVSIGDKTGDVYPVLWSEGDALGVFSRTAGTDIHNVQSLLSDESIGQNSGVFTSDDVKMAEAGATELLIYYPYREQVEGTKRAVLGMFDPSARLCTGSNLLSFAVPISKFMEMIDQMEESFLITDTWKMMQKRM